LSLRPVHTRAVRTPGHREALGRKLEFDPETKAQYNSWKNAVDAVENDLARWSKPVAPINWENYEANIDAPGFVEFLKVRGRSAVSSTLSTDLAARVWGTACSTPMTLPPTNPTCMLNKTPAGALRVDGLGGGGR
jgi:hypothetical protein